MPPAMVKYAFMNFPNVGQINPTLAIVEELVERGEEVVYFLPQSFRSLIEHTGASFHPIEPSVYAHLRAQPEDTGQPSMRSSRTSSGVEGDGKPYLAAR